MSTPGWRQGGVGILAVLLLTGASESTAGARSAQQCAASAPLPAPPTPRPRYTLSVRVLPGLQAVTGTLTVGFGSASQPATDRLVFRLWPNARRYARTGAGLTVSAVRERGRVLPVSYTNPTTLVVHRPVAAGERVVVSMSWRLVLPRETGLRMKGGGRSMRLGSFFPLLAWNGREWALDPPTRLRAEAWTTPTADFDVHLAKPRGLQALATGAQVAPGRWRAQAVRDFTIALARFTVVRGTARVPHRVRVTVGVERARIAVARQIFLRRAITGLQRLSALYGPYPWRTYTVVAMGDLIGITGGLEYPGLVYQPSTSENVAHETAHQWFYSLVGNNSARDPWLDEGLATWAETAITGSPPFPDATIPAEVANRIGEPMAFWDKFEYGRFFLGAYLQPYRALLSLGPRSVVDCALQTYVLRNAYSVAEPRDLLDALRIRIPDAEQKLRAYGARF